LSRLRSSRGSSTATPTAGSRSAAGAQRRPGVFVQAPKSDIYVAMLGVALGAIVLATLLMTLLFSRYSFSTKVSAASSPPPLTRLA
jgi:hypothetical protein